MPGAYSAKTHRHAQLPAVATGEAHVGPEPEHIVWECFDYYEVKSHPSLLTPKVRRKIETGNCKAS